MPQAHMEERLENLDRRTLALEQILPTLATKQDLERFATKQDLDATKEDLRGELERYATKEDLKEGLADTRSQLMASIESVKDDVRLVAEGLATLVDRLERKGVI